MKTIAIPEDLHKDLISLKLEAGDRTAAELIKKLIIEYRKQRLKEAGKMFRSKMKEKGVSLGELLRESRKVREDIANERFG